MHLPEKRPTFSAGSRTEKRGSSVGFLGLLAGADILKMCT